MGWLVVIAVIALGIGGLLVGRKVRGPADGTAMDRLLNQHRDVLSDSFALNPGSRYRVLQNRAPLRSGSVVVYHGTHQVPADRGWDYYHAFATLEDEQLLLPLERCPRSIAESLMLFADVPEDAERDWRNPSLMRGLFHRARKIRERSAQEITNATVGLDHALPRLFDLAMEAGSDSEFLRALVRLRERALPVVESLDDNVSEGKRRSAEKILTALGSKKYVANYRDSLLSQDPIEIRRAAKRLGELGDRIAEPRLQELMQHENMNVRFAARDALAKLAAAEP